MRHEHGEVHAKDGQVYSVETGKTFALIPYWDETEEQEFDQDLIAEAFNVAHETGLTPKELQQKNEKLLDILKNARKQLQRSGINFDNAELYNSIDKEIKNTTK